MKCDCGIDNSYQIDQTCVKGKLYHRYLCGKCDEGDWWEDNDGVEVSSPYEDDETDTMEDV